MGCQHFEPVFLTRFVWLKYCSFAQPSFSKSFNEIGAWWQQRAIKVIITQEIGGSNYKKGTSERILLNSPDKVVWKSANLDFILRVSLAKKYF